MRRLACSLTLRHLPVKSLSPALAWIWTVIVIVAATPSAIDASTQKSAHGKAVTGKNPSAPVRGKGGSRAARVSASKSSPEPRPSLKREHVIHRIRSGEKLTQLIDRFELSRSEKQRWARSFQRNFGERTLPAGNEIHFYFSKSKSRQGGKAGPIELRAVEVDYNDSTALTWEKAANGINFQQRERAYDVEVKTAGAVVDESLFADGLKAGIPSSLLSQIADIFTWNIDLDSEIRKGDSVKILYEQRTRKDREFRTSMRILAAELVNAGQKLTAIYFENQNGKAGYYDLQGRSLARAFLRFPLEFANISSPFTESRFHPILQTNLPHTGVDFAAKRGTPVRAVGDGLISDAGWNGSYGKTIDIEHDSTYTTRYAHLGGFAKGIRRGVKVKKGQIIGYVGSTGRSNGPHLHFELYKDHQYVNPLRTEIPADETIEPALQKIFDNQKDFFLVELTSTPQS